MARTKYILASRTATSRPAASSPKTKTSTREERKMTRAQAELALIARNPDASLNELKAVGDAAVKALHTSAVPVKEFIQ